MLWTVWKAFGWRFALENWVMGHFWKCISKRQEIYQQKLEEQVKHMLQDGIWQRARTTDHTIVVVISSGLC